MIITEDTFLKKVSFTPEDWKNGTARMAISRLKSIGAVYKPDKKEWVYAGSDKDFKIVQELKDPPMEDDYDANQFLMQFDD